MISSLRYPRLTISSLKSQYGNIAAAHCLRIVTERDSHIRMAREFGDEPYFNSL